MRAFCLMSMLTIIIYLYNWQQEIPNASDYDKSSNTATTTTAASSSSSSSSSILHEENESLKQHILQMIDSFTKPSSGGTGHNGLPSPEYIDALASAIAIKLKDHNIIDSLVYTLYSSFMSYILIFFIFSFLNIYSF